MSRNLRPYCPGLAYHITSRVTAHARVFDAPARESVVAILAEASTRTDAHVLAYAIMGNHLHVVARQHDDPISRLMQPALRRVALLVQKQFGVEGHAFERRFGSLPCVTAAHLRHAIVYTHLNPVRAGACSHPREADATSHHVYATGSPSSGHGAFVQPALELFATNRYKSIETWRDDYADFVSYRMQCDVDDAAGVLHSRAHPCVAGGDEYFCTNFSTIVDATQNRRPQVDLRDLAVMVLSTQGVDVPLASLRGGRLASRALRELRDDAIRKAAVAGHSGVAIASFFNMSVSRVSEITRRCG